jgi:trehalose synthase
VTSFLIEQVNAPASSREARVLDAIRRRTADRLAGRTVWCATAIPAGQGSAQRLRDRLRWTRESGVASEALAVPAAAPLRRLAQGLEEMLTGSAARPARLDAEDREIYAEGVADGEAAVEGRVRPDDVVVLHDPATATIADAVRDQGAHAVWQLRLTNGRRGAVAEALRFLSGYTTHVDAFVMTYPQRPRRGVQVTRIVAVIPAGDIVAAKDVAFDERFGETGSPDAVPSGDLGLSSLLAYLVEADRAECVGGTRSPKPSVSAH